MDITLGGKTFIVSEPCFKDLKLIIAAMNRLNSETNEKKLALEMSLILTILIGSCDVKKIKVTWWEIWKKPVSSEELQVLFQQLPAFLGLTPNDSSNSQTSTIDTDWNSLYWRIARVTGWTFSQIDTEMTLSRLSALSQHLLEKPLTDDLVAAYLGYEYQKPRTLHDAIDEMLAAEGLEHGKPE